MFQVPLDYTPLSHLAAKQLPDPLTHLRHLEQCHLTLRLSNEDPLHEHSRFWGAYQKKIHHITLFLT